MPRPPIPMIALIGCVLALAVGLAAWLANGKPAGPAPTPENRDPVIAAALNDPIMVDPDLVGQNEQNAALSAGGPDEALVPLPDREPERMALAKADAARLLGREPPAAPAPEPGAVAGPGLTAGATAAAALAALGQPVSCAAQVTYSAVWAAQMPPAVPIYPRGHVREAAGVTAPGCLLRSVQFETPVGLADVLNFYWARGQVAGLTMRRRLSGTTQVLTGTRSGGGPGGGFALYLRDQDGMTRADLVTSGLP